jgi:hypothetical protein
MDKLIVQMYNEHMTTTMKPVDELEPGATFSFPEDEDKNIYVLENWDWHAPSVSPVELTYSDLGSAGCELHRTSHHPSELVEVWT